MLGVPAIIPHSIQSLLTTIHLPLYDPTTKLFVSVQLYRTGSEEQVEAFKSFCVACFISVGYLLISLSLL